MKIANATDIKNRFGEYLDLARDEPVEVRKTGRPVAVLLAWKEYERLSALEDTYWALRAREAERNGYIGPEAAMKLIRGRMLEKAGSDT
jgi:prevent-host-death family protein